MYKGVIVVKERKHYFANTKSFVCLANTLILRAVENIVKQTNTISMI